jgi:hypothetical protein
MDYQKSNSGTVKQILAFIICLLLAIPGVFPIFAQTSGQIDVEALIPGSIIEPEDPAGGGGATLIHDLISPVISDIEIIELGRNSVRIAWKTNELSVPQINYGKTLDYEKSYIGNSFSLQNSVLLRNLLEDTLYHFSLVAIDRDGNRTSTLDQTFQTLPLPDVKAPANVSGFQAIPGENQISLMWQNPPDIDFKAVVITRKEEFYPSAPNEGILVYDGRENLFVDTGLTNGKRYYYTVFSYDESGNYASGAIASAIPRAPAAPEPPIEIFPPAVPPELVPPEIKKLELQDFDFIQDFHEIVLEQEIKIKAKQREPLTISIDYEKVPEVLKTMMVTLKTTGQEEKFFSFLLKINKEKTKYMATIIPPEPGFYSLILTNLDYKNQTLKTVSGELEIEKTEGIKGTAAQTVDKGDTSKEIIWQYLISTWTYIYIFFWVAFAVIIIFFLRKISDLYKNRKKRIADYKERAT